MPRTLILAAFLALSGCATQPAGQIIRGGPAPQPPGHQKLCAEQPGAECPAPALRSGTANVPTRFIITVLDNGAPAFMPLVCSTVVFSFLDDTRRALKDCK